MKRNYLITILLLYFIPSLWGQSVISHKREMRGVWIATVENIDWPSKPGLSIAEQKREIRSILNNMQAVGMNTVILQVRPAADAFYYSRYEPWSIYLTGKQGIETYPYYDPLEFIIDEAHKRCMELHAWVNPYRVSKNTSYPLHRDHIYHKRKDWFITYGKQMFYDPGNPEVRQFVVNIINDIVKRYDIDGLHMDDYFYPYKIEGKAFPDQVSYSKYKGRFTNIADWRRNNVDMMVKEVSEAIKATKPFVQFGISPFAVWKNKADDPRGSNTDAFTNYDGLYANVYKWLENKWLDYITPQCYFAVGHDRADYKELVDWWSANSFGANLYIGEGVHRLVNPRKEAAWLNGNEIVKHLHWTNNRKAVQGQMYFSAKSFEKNPKGLNDKLQYVFYKRPALPPISFKHQGRRNSAKLHSTRKWTFRKNTVMSWDNSQSDDTRYYIIYAFGRNEKVDFSNPRNIVEVTSRPYLTINEKLRRHKVYVSCVDKYRIENTPVLLQKN